MITGTVTPQGRVTIPKKIRDLMKLQAYDKIGFIPLEDGNVLLTVQKQPAEALFGMLQHKNPQRPVSVEEMDAAIAARRKVRTNR